jgi:hypothetical protein
MKREELWTPSARRFECLLKAAQNGDYNAYMSLMARFFKVMDDKARNNYLRDYEMLNGSQKESLVSVLKMRISVN